MYLEIKDRAQCSIGLVSKVLHNYKDFGHAVNSFQQIHWEAIHDFRWRHTIHL